MKSATVVEFAKEIHCGCVHGRPWVCARTAPGFSFNGDKNIQYVNEGNVYAKNVDYDLAIYVISKRKKKGIDSTDSKKKIL